MTKVFIATPAFQGKVNIQYAISLTETVVLLKANDIEIQFIMSKSGSLLCAERNSLTARFLKTDCTHMLCIDSDLGWPAQAVIEMLKTDKDFVAGIYPCRGENLFLFRPLYNENGSIKTDGKLLEMDTIPAGFMLIKRNVIEKMIADTPELAYCPKENKDDAAHGLFETKIIDGEFWGEDFIFCKRAKASGFNVYVDPLIEFDHDGTRGMLINALCNKSPEEQRAEAEKQKELFARV